MSEEQAAIILKHAAKKTIWQASISAASLVAALLGGLWSLGQIFGWGFVMKTNWDELNKIPAVVTSLQANQAETLKTLRSHDHALQSQSAAIQRVGSEIQNLGRRLKSTQLNGS